MKTMRMLLVGVTAGVAIACGCSQEDRDEVSDRITSAGRALAGNGRSDDERTPHVVRECQRKERKRQDLTWTAENRSAYPIEYCQAQLGELRKYSAQLDAAAHEVACTQSATKRQLAGDEVMIRNLEGFLAEAKREYRSCDSAGSWPVTIGGYALSKDAAKDKIVDAAQKLPQLKARVLSQKNKLVHLGRKFGMIEGEQKRIASLQERIQNTINDLRIEKVIVGERGVADALNAIHDSMTALGVDYNDPAVEDIATPSAQMSRDDLFRQVMAE